MRVLGIDPGTVRTGYGFVEDTDNPVLLGCGVLEAPAKQPIEQRLLVMHRGITALIARTPPDAVAVEEPFVVREARNSAMAVGEARAVALIAAAAAGVPVFQYPPARVRQSVTSYGASTKEQVRTMVGMLLGVQLIGEPLDACDALAVAICHLRESRLGEIMDAQSIATQGRQRRPVRR
jgi:crossover junction endodeoxyribonuclease RuvC